MKNHTNKSRREFVQKTAIATSNFWNNKYDIR